MRTLRDVAGALLLLVLACLIAVVALMIAVALMP